MIRCKRRRLHRSKESCKQKDTLHKPLVVCACVFVSLLAYYNHSVRFIVHFFLLPPVRLWRLQRCFIVRLLPPLIRNGSSLRLFPSGMFAKNRLRLSPAVLALAEFSLLPCCRFAFCKLPFLDNDVCCVYFCRSFWLAAVVIFGPGNFQLYSFLAILFPDFPTLPECYA